MSASSQRSYSLTLSLEREWPFTILWNSIIWIFLKETHCGVWMVLSCSIFMATDMKVFPTTFFWLWERWVNVCPLELTGIHTTLNSAHWRVLQGSQVARCTLAAFHSRLIPLHRWTSQNIDKTWDSSLNSEQCRTHTNWSILTSFPKATNVSQ